MSMFSLFEETGPTGFGSHSTAQEVTEGLDLSDRTVLVTGSNSGIGFETARALADRGARVLATARSAEKAERTCERLPGRVDPLVCELSEPASIRSCCETVRNRDVRLDALVANAGLMALPEAETKYGYELQFWVNHVGHFLFVTQLIERLTEEGRVVVVTSNAHRRAPEGGIRFDNLDASQGYERWTFYGQSKLANLLFAKELQRRFEEEPDHDRTAYGVHPGVVQTELTRHLHPALHWLVKGVGPLVMKNAEQGAATQTWAAVHPDAPTYAGAYLEDCNPAEPSEYATDAELAERLWQKTEEIIDEIEGRAS